MAALITYATLNISISFPLQKKNHNLTLGGNDELRYTVDAQMKQQHYLEKLLLIQRQFTNKLVCMSTGQTLMALVLGLRLFAKKLK